MMRFLLSSLVIVLGVSTALTGEIYEATGTDGKTTVKHELWFGGGKNGLQVLNAFDPQTKKIVRMEIDRSKGEKAKVAAQIWDYKTGRTIDLYKFPGSAHPLPLIPSIEEFRICPITGDTKLKVERVGFFD
jgi:hypothetical protein